MMCVFYHSWSLTKCHNLCTSISEGAIVNDFSKWWAVSFSEKLESHFDGTSKYILLASIQLKIVNIPNNTLSIITVLYYNSDALRSAWSSENC